VVALEACAFAALPGGLLRPLLFEELEGPATLAKALPAATLLADSLGGSLARPRIRPDRRAIVIYGCWAGLVLLLFK
jgi:hypothetical protein